MSEQEKDLPSQSDSDNPVSVPENVFKFLSDAGKKGGAVKGACKRRGGKRYYERISKLAAAARKRNAAARKEQNVHSIK